MTKTIPNSEVVAGVIEQLGGTVIPGDSLTFDLPLSLVRATIPKLNDLGVGLRKISERTETSQTGPETIARLVCINGVQEENPLASDLASMLMR